MSLGLLAGVYALGLLAVHFRPDGASVAAWWPATGVAVILVTYSPRARWSVLVPAVAAVSAAANVTDGRDLGLSVLFGLGDAGEAAVAALVLGGLRARLPQLRAMDDFLRLLAAALAGGLVAATGAALAVEEYVVGGSFADTLPQVLASHGAATLVLVPVAMAFCTKPQPMMGWELPAQLAAMLGVTLLVFSPDQRAPVTFVPIVLLAWCALRFDVRVVAAELAGFSVLVTFLSAQGYGPFGTAFERGEINALESGALTQGFLLCAALISLPLTIAVQQRQELVQRITVNELLFRRNFTESLVGMLILRADEGGLVVDEVNRAAAEILDAPAHELQGRGLDSLIEAGVPMAAVVDRLLTGNDDGWSGSARVRTRPGSQVRLAVAALPGDVRATLFSAQLLDVTQESAARRELEAAQRLTSATLDTTASVILVIDVDGNVVRVNAATTEITGYSEQELIGQRLWQTSIAPLPQIDVEALFLWPNRSGSPTVRERTATTKDGELLHLIWHCNIVREEAGFPAYAVFTGMDVTAERASTTLTTHLLQAAMTTALIGVDANGRITVFNAGAEHLLGYQRDDMVGRRFVSVLDAAQLLHRTGTASLGQAFTALVGMIDDGQQSAAQDWTWVTSSGRRLQVSMTLSITENALEQRVRFLCVGLDVSEQRLSQETLVDALEKERTAVERLRDLDTAKDEFVSTVSHELRTPVTSIVGYTEMLVDGSVGDPTPDQLRLLSSIARNGERLIVICNDLLALGGFESLHTPDVVRTEVELDDVMSATEEAIGPLLTPRRLEVSFRRPPSSLEVLGDRGQLERVLINLLSNAIKFTADGGAITVSAHRSGLEAFLVVSDTGIGIPESDLEAVFAKFFRTSDAQQRAIPGTGLGLAIVAGIIEAHGGRIGVQSSIDGTTFTVALPLRPDAGGGSAPRPVDRADHGLQRRRDDVGVQPDAPQHLVSDGALDVRRRDGITS